MKIKKLIFIIIIVMGLLYIYKWQIIIKQNAYFEKKINMSNINGNNFSDVNKDKPLEKSKTFHVYDEDNKEVKLSDYIGKRT